MSDEVDMLKEALQASTKEHQKLLETSAQIRIQNDVDRMTRLVTHLGIYSLRITRGWILMHGIALALTLVLLLAGLMWLRPGWSLGARERATLRLGTQMQARYQTATPDEQAQIRTLLGLPEPPPR